MVDRWDNLKEKGGKFVSDLDKNPHVQEVKQRAKQNPKEFILGGLMLLGLVLSYWWYGSLIVGVAAGLFAPWTIKDVIHRAENFYAEEGKLPSFMLAAAGVFLVFHTFWFVIGIVAGLTVKVFFQKHPTA